LKTNEIKLRSGATSLFDVQRWKFDVRRSSFKTTLYGINVTCEYLQNNLVLTALGPCPTIDEIIKRGFFKDRKKLERQSHNWLCLYLVLIYSLFKHF